MTYRFQAEIKAEHLRAMQHLAAVQDVRYYLQGVQVFATPEVILGATNGSVLGVLRTHQTASGCFKVRIPNDTIKQMGKAAGPVVLGSDDGKAWALKVGPITLGWQAQEEQYPELHRALPAAVTGEACKFDARLLALFWKVAKDLNATSAGEHSVLMGQNGENTALVNMPAAPDFIGGLAVLRRGPKHPEPQMSAPGWAKAAPNVPADWRDAVRTEEPCDLA